MASETSGLLLPSSGILVLDMPYSWGKQSRRPSRFSSKGHTVYGPLTYERISHVDGLVGIWLLIRNQGKNMGASFRILPWNTMH